jgi:hypothetical protein
LPIFQQFGFLFNGIKTGGVMLKAMRGCVTVIGFTIIVFFVQQSICFGGGSGSGFVPSQNSGHRATQSQGVTPRVFQAVQESRVSSSNAFPSSGSSGGSGTFSNLGRSGFSYSAFYPDGSSGAVPSDRTNFAGKMLDNARQPSGASASINYLKKLTFDKFVSGPSVKVTDAQTNPKGVSFSTAFQTVPGRNSQPATIVPRGFLDPHINSEVKANSLRGLPVEDSAPIIYGMASKDLTQTIGVVSAMDSNAAAAVLAYIHNNYDTNKGIPLTTQILGTGMQLDTAHDILCCMNTKDAKEILEEIGRFIPGHEFSIATGIVQVYQDPYTGVYNGLHNSNFNPKIQDNEGLVKLLIDDETSSNEGISFDTWNPKDGSNPVSTGSSGAFKDMINWVRASEFQNSWGINIDGIGGYDVFKSKHDGTVYLNPTGLDPRWRENYKVIDNVLVYITEDGQYEPVEWDGD